MSLPVSLGTSSLKTPRLAYGCWRIADATDPEENLRTAQAAVGAALEAGYTLFDLADIYCHGRSEQVFGRILRDQRGLREKIVIATKCGIRFDGEPTPDAPYRFDFSAEHITRSCEGSLKRMGIDTIDLYQLHRPDYLMDPEEVASAFANLRESGKVREFGLSNFRPSQVTLLQRACPMPLVVNQVEISLLQQRTLEDGTLDQCLAERITPLAWSPLGGGLLGAGPRRILRAQEAYNPDAALAEIDRVAKIHGCSRMVVALAWLLKHPAGIVPIVGSTNPARIREAMQALGVEVSREDWYRLLVAGRGEPLP